MRSAIARRKNPRLQSLSRSHVWDSIRPHFERGDWQICVRVVRAVVDADPFDIVKRYLLARLYLKLGDGPEATLQFEKLLPLCAGRGDLFRALAMQKHLDALDPSATGQAARYPSLHRWFRSMVPAGAGGVRAGPVVQEALLLSLPVEGFTRAAEAFRLEILDPGTRTWVAEPGTLWIVLHGQPGYAEQDRTGQWSGSRQLEEGHYVLVASTRGEDAPVRFTAASPVELLRLDGGDVRALTEAFPVFADAITELEWGLRGAGEAPQLEGLSPSNRQGGKPGLSLVRGTAPLAGGASTAGAGAWQTLHAPTAGRPTLRIERRGQHRLTVSTSSQVALLALPGVSAAPLEGTVRNLSLRGLCVTLAPDQDGAVLEPHLRSVTYIELNMAGFAKPLRPSGWLRWCACHGGVWVVGVEFARLTHNEREALERCLRPELAEEQYRFEVWEQRATGTGRRPARGSGR